MDRRRFHRLCGGLLSGAFALQREVFASTDKPGGGPGDGPGDGPANGAGNGSDQRSEVGSDNGSGNGPVNRSVNASDNGSTDSHGNWPRSRLVDASENGIKLSSLNPGEAHVFHYPYVTTPCFLIRLGEATETGSWPGGLGEDASVVAFSAICSHKMSHPARSISHIAYRADPVVFTDHEGKRREQAGLISCCSERSVYDPAGGAAVLSGPAPVPLAAIALGVDDDGTLVATASLGPDRYRQFFDAFGFRLKMEHRVSNEREPSGEQTIATPASEFSQQQIRC